MNGVYTPTCTPADVEAVKLRYKDVTYDNGGVYVSADGATGGGTTLNISWATLGLLPNQCTIIGAFIIWAWPLTEWTNGAMVTINNFTLNPTSVALHLATTCSQYYNLKIRVLYMEK